MIDVFIFQRFWDQVLPMQHVSKHAGLQFQISSTGPWKSYNLHVKDVLGPTAEQ